MSKTTTIWNKSKKQRYKTIYETKQIKKNIQNLG
jgi:hypothetical protein